MLRLFRLLKEALCTDTLNVGLSSLNLLFNSNRLAEHEKYSSLISWLSFKSPKLQMLRQSNRNVKLSILCYIQVCNWHPLNLRPRETACLCVTRTQSTVGLYQISFFAFCIQWVINKVLSIAVVSPVSYCFPSFFT